MIYVDLLIIENFILNYCVIIGTSLLLNRLTNIRKIILSSAVDTISLIFVNKNIIVTILISLIFSIVISIISFKYKNIIYTIKNIIYMYLLSIFIAGFIYLINTNFLPKVNDNISNFIILTLLSPIITSVYLKSINKIKTTYSNYYQIDIYLKNKPKITLISYLDTGNLLKDPYNHKPIILIDKQKINYHHEKQILVPYNTISNSGLLTCISPEKIYIHHIGYRKKVLIGLINELGIEGADCILNKELLERI